MLLVFVPKITSRVRYIFNLLLHDILGVPVQFTTSREEFTSYQGAKLIYDRQVFDKAVFFQSRELLFETGIKEQNITVSEWNGMKIFYATGNNSAFPFDPFAASFYLVSRYEEYLPHIRDLYDRFGAENSLAYQNDFLKQPLVNRWALQIGDLLKSHFPSLVITPPSYKFISTIDVDNAYAYKEKGVMRSLGGYAKALLKFDFEEISVRTKVLLRLMPDPYDTYDYQLALQEKYKFEAIYFILLGDYGVNDKNLPYQSRRFQSLIKKIGDYAFVGIHPSFGSNTKEGQLRKEVDRLSHILHRDITRSRQHFLKLSLPETYRNLIECDITDDYTMGYASQIGFRASICTPFNFYDLDNDIETKLKVHPFAFMESTFKYYLKIPVQEVMQHIVPLIKEVKSVGGAFISLWHNDSLTDKSIWKGWTTVYEGMLEEAHK